MGIHSLAVHELVSAQEHLPHARIPILWAECRRISSYERFASYDRIPLTLALAPANDRLDLARRFRRRDFCNSPVTRGVGRLDRRTQRRSERSLLHAHARRL